ncbi:MAG: glycosyltransferase family 1 protein, partial [Ignavibacteria bacterium]|nr:glycosyltransferase family 1 protein [Ignavibacteria bacterium]
MRVLYDVSVLGVGHTNSRARTVIFRVVENLASGLATADEVELSFFATDSLEVLNASVDYLYNHPYLSNILFLIPGWQKNVVRKTTRLIEDINQRKEINFGDKVIRRTLFSVSQAINRNTKTLVDKNRLTNIEL